MGLPFTSDQFFSVFAEYNRSFWFVALALWVASTAALAGAWRNPRQWSGALMYLLATSWIWNAVAYHALLFTKINPAAWLFAALFTLEGVLLFRAAARIRIEPLSLTVPISGLGIALACYALAYPFLSFGIGHRYPEIPTFGVPCPTAILTIGVLLGVRGGPPLSIAVIPAVWAFIGGSAALLFGVWTDYMLLAAGVSLAGYLTVDKRQGSCVSDRRPTRGALMTRRSPVPASPAFAVTARGAQFRDRIAVVVKAPPAAIFQALHELTLRDMKIAWLLGELRYLPSRLAGRMPTADSSRTFMKTLVEGGTLVLRDDAPREVITGSAAQLHRVHQAPRRFDNREAFEAFDDPGYEQLLMSVRVAPAGPPGEHWLILEHATRALSPGAEHNFAPYWRVIEPTGAFVTWLLLQAVRRRAERNAVGPLGSRRLWRSVRATRTERGRGLPGDERIPRAIDTLTHGVTIRRPPRDVWPWLVQMGAGRRGGWYSYDWLDNRCKPSASRIVPELQHPGIGTIFPALPGVAEGFTLLAMEPERMLMLGWPAPDGTPEVTWTFLLDELAPGVTRLLVRVRGGPGYRFHGLPLLLTRLVVRVVHFVMQRKQLLGVASRAETTVAAPADARRPSPAQMGRGRP